MRSGTGKQGTWLVGGLVAALVQGIALADGMTGSDASQSVHVVPGRTTAAATGVQRPAPPQALRLGHPLSGDALDGTRGDPPVVQVQVSNDGGVHGNTAQGLVSGDNTIAGDAFSNAAGISTVIQNSGSNVLIQNGTSVNVQFVDPTP